MKATRYADFFAAVKQGAILLLVSLCSVFVMADKSIGQTTVFTDDFNRGSAVSPMSNGGTPTMTYTTASTASTPGVSSANLTAAPDYSLNLQSANVAGVTYVTGPLNTYSSPFATTLANNSGDVTWTFNMRTNRSTVLSGFASGGYASAVVLGSTSSNLASALASGYLVSLYRGTTNNAIRLSSFTGGLTAAANVTAFISSADLASNTAWVSVKVIYTPTTNTWKLYVREDGTSIGDPTTVTTQIGSSTVNSTFTSSALTDFGFYWNHSTATPASNTSRFDNFKVTLTIISNPPTVSTNAISSVTASSAVSGGNVTSNGGLTVTRRGLVYSTGTITDTTSTTGGGLIIDQGTGTGSYSSNLTGLTNNTTYNVKAFALNSAGVSYGANQSFSTLQTDIAPTPAAQPTNYSATLVTCSGMTINWTAASSTDGYVVLRTAGTATPTTNPSNTVSYSAGASLGNATVVYVGSATSFTQSALTDNTTYTYTIYSYNGAGNQTSYLTASPLTGTTSTLSVAALTATAATNVYSNTFTANWTGTAACATSYNMTLNATENFENSLSLFTAVGGVFSSGTNTGGSPSTAPLASSGTYGYLISNGTATLTSKAINTNAVTSPSLSFKLSALSYLVNTNGIDASDYLFVDISPDNGTTWYSTVRIGSSVANGFWAFGAATVASTPYDGDNTVAIFSGNGSGTGIGTVQITGLPNVSQLRVRIQMINNAAAEAWVIDDFKIGGTISVTGNSLIVNNPVSGSVYNYAINSVAPNSTATSNVISVSVPAAATPAIDIPTVSNITTNSANVTVNVLNVGSTSSISARGTVYKTSTGVTATDNALADANATTGSFTQTRSLSPETRYFVKGYATNAEGTGLSSEVNFFTLSNPPVTQATSLSATPFSSSQIDLSWVAADFPSSGATRKRYLLLRATAPDMPIFTGTNGFAPTVNANTTIVNANISDLSSSASATGLSQTTDYNFMLIPYTWNGTDSATISYLTTAAPTTSGSTSETTPALLNNPTATEITNNSAILGANIVSDGGVGIADRGTVYNTSSPVIISNNTLSEGGFDLGTFSHLRTDLLPQTKYYFAGYAVNNAGSLSLSNESSFYTYANPPVANASNLIATGTTGAQINLSWNSAVFPTLGATFTGYLLLRADYPNVPSITNGNGQAPVAGLNTTIVNAAISGNATTASSSGLTGSTRYNYVLIPYTWDGVNAATYNYLISGAPSADGITLAPIPTSQPFSLSFSNVSCSGMTLTWRKANSLPDGYIAIRSSGTLEPATDPTPGVVYSLGSTINNATVVYIGSDSTVVLSSLSNTTQNNYKIFSYNGSGSNISYNTNTPLKGSQITSIPSAPVATAATGISLTQVTANWNAEACANNGYKLDVSTFPNFYNPTGGSTSLALESFENSLSLFTASGTGASYFSGNSPTTNKPPAAAGGTYPYATTGTYAYGVANGTNVLTSNDINTAGFEAAELNFRLAAFSYAATSNGLDATDLVKVEISPDGGSTWLNTLIVTGNNNAYWGYDATGVATTPYDGDNNAVTLIPASGNNLTTGYSTINISNLPNVAQLKVRITMTNGTSELWTIDNFTVSGKTASYVDPYNNYTVAGTSQVLSGLTSNTTYYYRVRANGNGATSLNSNTISATPESGFATVNTPTVTSITNNSADLGATIVNTGADVSISARGTVYKTSTGVTATDNVLAEGGTGVSAYSHVRSGLSPQTKYFFKGYATNSFGTGISSEANFFTLSNPATSAAGSFTATAFSSDEVNLSWSAANFPSTGATVKGYVILRALYPNVPSLSNSNGQTPAAGANSSIVTSSLSSTATATSATGLNGDTRYNFIIIPYTWDGTNEATYNYFTTNAPLADANTLIPVTALPPTNLSVTTITCNGMTIGWTPGTGADGTIVLQTSGTAVPNTNPTPNVFYTVGSVIGNATVAYVGNGSTFTLSSLLDNTNYNFKLISYNATGTDIGYLTSSPLAASQSTLSAATPVANNATNIASTSFTANWNPISCATNYLLYVYTNNNSNIVAWTFPTLGTNTVSDSSQTNATNLGNNRLSLSSGSISDVSGNSTRAASGTTWSVNKFWQVIANTTGYTSIKVSSVQNSSASGPRDFKIQYKIRAGGTWTDVTGGTIVVKNNFTNGVLNNLVLPTACDNTDSLYLRWICASTYPSSAVLDTGALTSGGTNRIDDIYVRGNLVQYVAGYNGLSVNGTSANVTGLSASSQYFYHVRAVGTSGGQTAISNVVPVTTFNDIATADFRTRASGNFNDANIWEYRVNATSYANANAVPASTNNIVIRAVDSVNMNTDFVINSGKSFIDSGKINLNSFVISGLGSCRIVAGATMYTANTNGIYSSTSFLGSITTTSRTFDAAANYVFNGTSAQSTAALPSTLTGNLIISNPAGVTLNSSRTINAPGSLTVTSNGKFLFGTGVGSSTFSINGTGGFTAQTGATLVITNSNGICAPGTPTVTDTLGSIRLSGLRTFGANVNYEISKSDGSSSSRLGSSFGTEINSINNLTINNPRGSSLSGSNITLNGTLSLVSGRLSTGINKVIIGNSGNVSRTDTSWIIGNLEKNIATGATSATYEIGDSTNFTPVTISFGNVTTAGKLMAASISGAHPNVASSILSNTKRLNFYTKLTGTGIVFNNCNVTVNFNNPANLVGGANPTSFIAGLFNSGWTYPTVGTLSTTSAKANGLTDFGDVAFAEAGCTIVASASSNSPVCSGSSIQLSSSTTGANGVVGYDWNGPAGFTSSLQNPVITNASSLNAGVYTVTTTDALGCTSTTTTTVVVNALPVAGINNTSGVTELTCTNSSISVTATGGTSYSWNNGLGNNATVSITSAGIYTVTATSNGCSSTESITITEDKILPTAGIDNNTGSTEINCATPSISVTATGGVSYSWSNGLGSSADAIITTAGTYTVTVTGANGCTSTSSITITSNTTTPTASITNNTGSTVLTCAVSAISVTANGGASYSWSNGLGNNANAAITSAGTYTVTVTSDNGCSSTASITVTSNTTAQSAGITNNSGGATELNCVRSSISVTATGGGTYSWNNGLGSDANQTITAPGVYVVTVTGNNGCTSSASISITSNTTAPTASIDNNTNVSVLDCNTTSISLSANGGGTYSWNNGLGTNADQTITNAGTYIVTVTGANGCTATASTVITANTAAPSASITNNTGATELNCTRTSISVLATGGESYSWSNGLGAEAAQVLTSAGTYTVTVTGTNGCTATASITITSNTTAPTAAITNNTGVTELTCAITSISVTAAGGGTYSWNNGLGNNANATITAPGTYAVLVTGANGCTADDAITITADKFAPNAAITNNTGSTELTCTRQSISVTATGGVSYSWNNGLGNNANASITEAGTYTVTVTGANGCTSTSNITVTSNTTAPIAGIVNNTGTTVITCTTPSISVTATGGVSYSWNNGLGNSDNATITSAGTYTVTVTDDNGCSSTASITITSNTTAPEAAITNNSGTSVLTCSTSAINVTATGNGSYSWNNGLGDVAAATITSAGTYTVTVTGANGCTSTSSITVTSNTTAPTALIVNNTGSVQITCATPSISVTATGGGTYSWNNGLGNSATATITSAGTYTVTVTGANGCTATDEITITSNTTAPSAGITNNSGTTEISCNTPEINLIATGNGTYSWNNNLGDNANVTVTSAGTYTVTVTAANGCTATSSVTVTSNTTAPIASITNNTGTTVLNCLTSSISVTATGGVSYEWDNSLGNSATANITAEGTYTVTVTGANGCTSTASITVTSNTAVPNAVITNNTGSTVLTCATTSISLTATGGGTYSWNNGLGNNATVNISAPGTYTVTVTGASGCTSTASVVVTVGPGVPTVGYTATATSVCAGTAVTLSGTGADTYTWTGGITNEVSFVPTATTTYTVTGTENIGGCSNTASVTITVNPKPTGVISGTTSICTGASANLSIAVTGNGPWSGTLSDGTSFSGSTSPITVSVSPVTNTTYTIASLTASSCSASSISGSALVTVNNFTVDTIVGPKNACIYTGTSSTLNATFSVAATNASGYVWTLPTGATLISGAGTNTISVHYVSTFTSGTISVAVSSTCGSPITKTVAITKTLSAAPTSISGPTSVCSFVGTSTQATYTSAVVTGSIKYSWTLPTTVTIVSATSDSSSINVTFGSGFVTSTFSVRAVVGCGTTTPRTLSVSGTAAAPTAGTTTTRCGAGLVTFSATPGAGETIDWYSATTAGTLLRSGSLTFDSTFTTAGTKTLFAASRNITNGCISATRTAVTATINALPTAVTVSVSAASCGANAVTLSATAPASTTLRWFADSSTTGTVLATGTSYTTPVLSSTTKYFVASQSTVNGCYSTSLRSATATINAVPGLPTVNITQSRCGAGSITLTATAPTGSAVWFRDATTNTALTTATTATVTYATPATSAADSTYFVASKSTAGCFSARTAVLARIVTAVNPPLAVNASRCGAGAITIGATPVAGETIDWYTAATAGTLIRSNSLTLDTSVTTASRTFFAAARNTSTGCVSATRATVIATFNALPTAVTVTVSAASCGANAVTLSATAPASTTLNWFADSSTTGTVLATGTSYTTPVLSSTTKYFVASRSAAGCYSLSLRSATATINAVPGLPTVNTTQPRCGIGSIVLTATAPTGSAVWFRNEVGGTALTTLTTATVTYRTPATSASDSTYYVATKSTAGCFSARTAVLAKINALPAAPTTTGTSVCGVARATVSAATTAVEGTIDWYSATTAGTLLRSNSLTFDSLITATRTFFALARVTTTGCVSATRTAAVATFNALLAAPTTLTGTTSICPIVGTATGATYTATAVTNAVSYLWTIPAGAVIDSGSNGLKIKVRFVTAGLNDSIFVQAVAASGCAGAKKVLKLVTTGCGAPIAKAVSSTTIESMSVNVFPNPTTSNFNVQVLTAGKENIKARILDMQGRQIKSITINPYETIAIGADLKAGSYIIEVRQGKNIKTTRILKF